MSQPSAEPSAALAALSRRDRAAGVPDTYLVLLREADVAQAAAAALEDLHAARGSRAVALVPPVRGRGFVQWLISPEPEDRTLLHAWCVAHLPAGAAPVLVGLDEDGLGGRLRLLGLTAYLGIPPRDGALIGGRLPGLAGGQVDLIPVSTVRDLVRVVAAGPLPCGPVPACSPLAARTPLATATPVTALAALAALADANRPAPARRRRSAARPTPRHQRPAAPARTGIASLAGALAITGLAPAAMVSAHILPVPSRPGYYPVRQAGAPGQPGRHTHTGTPVAHVSAPKALAAAADASRKAMAEKAAQPQAARPARYTVRPGDSLSAIAERFYHSPDAWPVLYRANRSRIRSADLIIPGQVLDIPAEPGRIRAAAGLLKPGPTGTAAPAASYKPRHARPEIPAGGAETTTATGGHYPGGAFGACVVARESSGIPQVMNSTGHYGLYQFSAPTWAEYGGNPADFGHASVAEQNQVFATALARGGEYNWAPYDGC